MATGEILIDVFSGARQPLDAGVELLVTAMDGQQKTVVRAFKKGSEIRLTNLEVHDNFADRYTVLLAAKAHSDAGFTPVKVVDDAVRHVELMMLRREAAPVFEPFETIEKTRPELHALLCGTNPSDGKASYERWRNENQLGLACLLNITTALEQMTLAPFDGLTQKPLASFKALDLESAPAPAQDRFFAWVPEQFLKQVAATVIADTGKGFTRLVEAPKGLHPGATVSYKQTDFGEGNVQLTFHEKTRDKTGKFIKIEADIDYFKDAASHILFEVFPNKLRARVHGKDSSAALTDPKCVYGLRWIAARQRGQEFNPPYVLQ